MKHTITTVIAFLLLNACATEQEKVAGGEVPFPFLAAANTEGGEVPFPFNVEPDTAETLSDAGAEADRRYDYSRRLYWSSVPAGRTWELKASCDYGDIALSANFRTSPNANITVDGPFEEGKRTMFYQTYRPESGGGYEFTIRVFCESR